MNILILDEEVYLAQKVAMRLQEEGNSCTHVSNIKEIDLTISYDVVLLSTNISSSDVHKIIVNFKNSIVILLVSYINDTTVTKPLKDGASDYIVKPFDAKELIARIDAKIRKYKKNKTNDFLLVGDLIKIDLQEHSIYNSIGNNQKLLELNPEAYILHEFITSGFTVLKGKVYRGNFPYLIRDHGPSGTTYNEKKIITHLDWLTKTSWGTEYNSMINAFIYYINENEQISKNKYNLHRALIKFYRKRLIYDLYENDSKLLLMLVHFIIKIEMFFNLNKLLSKTKKIFKKKFCKVIIKNNYIIKNKKTIRSNYDLKKIINFLKINISKS